MAISLSKMIRINVDPRGRSDRPEIINLHYDRLHNPENCYHLELSWMNVTSKFVEDAIVSWATQAEKYGLRLIELPMAEARAISSHEPFRSPYRISLKVVPPPLRTTTNGVLTSSSFSPVMPTKSDNVFYQKRLLEKFNFVLDLEAASEFPPDVKITYTWSKLDYKYNQYVHRSGILLAQITDDGDILIASNRLYNTRSAISKDSAGDRHDPKKAHEGPKQQVYPTMPASGVLGLNAHPASPHPSPLVRASAEVLGSEDAVKASSFSHFVTPEQIKFELEEFCQDENRLTRFYHETTPRELPAMGTPISKKSLSSSSSVRPIKEGLEVSIPDLRLPARLVENAAYAAGSAFGYSPGLARKVSPGPERVGSRDSYKGKESPVVKSKD